MLITRATALFTLLADLAFYPSVGLIGARQVGKTTLVKEALGSSKRTSVYLDLQLPSNRILLSDAEAYLRTQQDKLVVLDEVQTFPELFPVLRGSSTKTDVPAGSAYSDPPRRNYYVRVVSRSQAVLRRLPAHLREYGSSRYRGRYRSGGDEKAPGDASPQPRAAT